MSFLASLESKMQDTPAPAPEPKAKEQAAPDPDIEIEEGEEESEETEDPEIELEEGEEESEESDEDEETEEPEAGAALDDKTEYQVGDERVTGAELRKGYMRQADYTRKTQALADK